ncbi:MAG: hypothetical protein RR759_08645 [Ruthenibacterium sp.]
MKKTIILLTTLALSLSLVACGGAKPASSVAAVSKEASSVAVSAAPSASAAVAEISVEDAKTLVKEKIDAGLQLWALYMGNATLDTNTPMEAGSTYFLVQDDAYKTMDELKAFTEKTFSKKMAEESFYGMLEGEYATFAEKDGKLYGNKDAPAKGLSATFDTDSLTIKSQTPETLTVELDFSRFDEPQGKAELNLIKENDNWVLDSKIDI